MAELDLNQRTAPPTPTPDHAGHPADALHWHHQTSLFGRLFETFDFVQYLIVITAYVFYLIESPWRGWPHFAIWTATYVAFVASQYTERWFLARGQAEAYIALRIAIATFAVWFSDVHFLTTFIFFIIVANAWGISTRAGIFCLILSAISAYSAMFLAIGTARPSAYVTLIPWLAGLAFMASLTQLTKREQQARARSEALLGELTAAHRQLQQYAEQAGELATMQERNRLAREIHDSLGHYLTIINVQLESAQALRSRDTDRADRAVGEAKRLASEALADVRRSVASLRPSALDTLSISQAIERQVADFREHSGLAVDLAIEGDETRCSQAAGLALYRATQEGLTNIRKHAGATRVAIRLRFGPATTELAITDNGRGLPATTPTAPRPDGSGNGIVGLRERLNLLGGTLDLRPNAPGGTQLIATIPHRG
ncbi:MAG: sensor histidine kinase [Chloroflexia bacterium]